MHTSIVRRPRIINSGMGGLAPFTAPAATFLLDTLSATAAFAVSSRKLKAAYAGKAMNVTTSAAGNAMQDIGFDGSGNLDLTSGSGLNTFIGSNTGTINDWYDQSGNSADASSGGTLSIQPTVRNSGINVTQNGHVWATASGSSGLFNTLSFAQPYTLCLVGQLSTTSPNDQFFGGNGANQSIVGTNFGGVWFLYDGTFVAGGTADTAVHSFVAVFNTASPVLYVDGSPVSLAPSLSGATMTGLELFSGLTGQLGEVLAFPSILGAPDIAKIHSSCTGYWGTP